MTTALFLLRACQIGLSLTDLKELTLGMVFDIITEHSNDDHEYAKIATQEDINAILRW